MNAQAASSEFRPASPGLRLVAFLMDVLPVGLAALACFLFVVEPRFYPGFVAQYLEFAQTYRMGDEIPTSLQEAVQTFFLLTAVGFFVYCVLAEWLWQGRTLGKRIVRIYVVKFDEPEEPLTLADAFSRNLLKAVGIIIPLMLLIDAVSAFFNQNRLSLHDRFSHTIVLDENGEAMPESFPEI